MGRFLLGLILALAIGAGVYYFMLMDAAEEAAAEPETVRGADLDVQADPIPDGVIMEDGTLD